MKLLYQFPSLVFNPPFAALALMRGFWQNRGTMKTCKTFLAAVAGGDAAVSEEAFRVFSSEIDKAAKKGAITKNAADRRKSRARALVAKKA